MITLREVCENVGVSRRAVQGYEKAGLVAPTGTIKTALKQNVAANTSVINHN